MSNIYLKIAINKKLHTQNFDLARFSDSSEVAPTHADNIEFSNSCRNFKIRGLGVKLCVAFLLF